MDNNIFTVDESISGIRVDLAISQKMQALSRSYIQRLIKEQHVLVEDKAVRASYQLSIGQKVEVIIPVSTDLTLVAESIPLSVVFEDEHIVVLDKAAGMVVHPAAGHDSGTLVNALLAHCGNTLPGINGVNRPGIVHRLDKDTSGLMVVAKTEKAMISLSLQLKEHTAGRRYYAVVKGNVRNDSGTVDAPIGRHANDRKKMAVTEKNSKSARTDYCVLERYERCTLVECKLHSGRTHQIRVHMAYIGHPLVGDPVYGGRDAKVIFPRQALHAHELTLKHPATEEIMIFKADIPEDMLCLIKKMKKQQVFFT